MMQMIDPTERSMPPAMITIASPHANNAISTPSIVSSFLNAFIASNPCCVSFRLSGRQLQDVRVGQLLARELARDHAPAQYQCPVTQGRDLVGLRAGDDDALTLRRQLADDVVDVALGLDVEAARRLVGQEHGR